MQVSQVEWQLYFHNKMDKIENQICHYLGADESVKYDLVWKSWLKTGQIIELVPPESGQKDTSFTSRRIPALEME